MLRLLIDHNVDYDILRGLFHRLPQLDAVTAFEIGMSKATDAELLNWAALAGRVLVTHDLQTMPGHATDLMAKGKTIAGHNVALTSLPLHQVIEDLEVMIACSENDEWANVVRYLPLKSSRLQASRTSSNSFS